MPKKLMLDTNIYDRIIARRGFTDRLNQAVVAGHIEILRTHIQDDEIARIPNAAKQAEMRKVRVRKIPTSGAAWGMSRWGEARWGGSGAVKFSDITKGNPIHAEDALIAMTAEVEADVLVTEDRAMETRVREKSKRLEVWRFDQLVTFVEGFPE